jgi:hypothetical protein
VTTPAPIVIAQSIPPMSGSSAAASVAEQILSALGAGRLSRQNQTQVVDLLRNDPDLNATLRELAASPAGASASGLTDLIRRVDVPDVRRDMIDLLARGADDANAQAIRRGLDGIDVQQAYGGHAAATSDQIWQVRFNLVRLGVPTSGPTFNRAPYAGLVSSNPYAAFTGVGATGVNPTEVSLSTANQLGMAARPDDYRNPVSANLSGYLSGLSSADRIRQAELFLNQPISTPFLEVWGNTPPSRAQVIDVAARQYNLHPNVVAGFLLAEQRDQSRIEDAADMYSAWYGRDASIGLGQIRMSTANQGMLADSVSGEVSRAAGHTIGMSRLLADDAANIFAAARYIRQVADAGANISLSTLEARTLAAQQAATPAGQPIPTQSTYTTVVSMYPGFNPSAYSQHSSQWPTNNIAALASEYTSRAWDGRWSAWGHFVLEAHNDVRASRVFQP